MKYFQRKMLGDKKQLSGIIEQNEKSSKSSESIDSIE